MKKIIAFNDQELELIEWFKSSLAENEKMEDIISLCNNEIALEELANAISLYPSILGKQRLGNSSRSVETLVDNLCLKDVMDIILHIPSKAILGQSFFIAKINFFLMLKYLNREINDLESVKDSVNEIISNSIFTLMAEDVFISIISDKNISLHIRTNAGYLLALIWEYRIDHGVKEFAPILTNIWSLREKMKPAYGTMFGISELFELSRNSAPAWLDFIQSDELGQDEIDSLQEFLMGLSFEEMETISGEMEQRGKNSITREEVETIIGISKAYPEYEPNDPRDLYKSFNHRKSNAIYRSRGGKNGPKKTIEEYLMCFLLARPEM